MATTLRLNAEAQAALDALVADERVSANEIIQRAIVDRAARRGLSAEVRAAFATMGAITKYDIAKCIASKIDAFAGLAPRARKAWETEDRRMALFDAASRALTYYYKLAHVGDASGDERAGR